MKLRISPTILEDLQPAIEDADPTDPTDLKIFNAKRTPAGVVIDADDADIKELVDRGRYKIEVARENIACNDDVRFHLGQIKACEALQK